MIFLVCAGFVTRASTASAQDEPIPEAPSEQTVAAPISDSDTVRVFISSDREGTIFGSAAAFGPEKASPRGRARFNWNAGVCTAPCTARIALSDNPYRVVGRAMIPSSPFNLPFSPTGVDVHVRAGSLVGILGLAFAVDGVTFTGIGGAALIAYEALGQPRVVNNTPGGTETARREASVGCGIRHARRGQARTAGHARAQLRALP
jgi:hypothetical protein